FSHSRSISYSGWYFAPQIKQQISGWRRNAELSDHAHYLSAVQCGIIDDVLHLINQPQRTRIAAEKPERQVSSQSRFLELGDQPGPSLNHLTPTLGQDF